LGLPGSRAAEEARVSRATGSRRELAEDGRGGGGGNGLSQTARLVWTMGSMWQAKWMDGSDDTEGNKRPNIHSRSLCESSITRRLRSFKLSVFNHNTSILEAMGIRRRGLVGIESTFATRLHRRGHTLETCGVQEHNPNPLPYLSWYQ
jgi:hypothetical protein